MVLGIDLDVYDAGRHAGDLYPEPCGQHGTEHRTCWRTAAAWPAPPTRRRTPCWPAPPSARWPSPAEPESPIHAPGAFRGTGHRPSNGKTQGNRQHQGHHKHPLPSRHRRPNGDGRGDIPVRDTPTRILSRPRTAGGTRRSTRGAPSRSLDQRKTQAHRRVERRIRPVLLPIACQGAGRQPVHAPRRAIALSRPRFPPSRPRPRPSRTPKTGP